ncbi:hypothetical protein DBR06_SOUSAS37610003 [Sousa chinensis]|uniref:Uncharacterized protein n=1 Tax=Sousa chinensis TaxID=103600 RepID=A0A484GL45_SOUCH|nr:hypothetical protein DBR06_SOUSAS37610003 [Sousa chinensis]
MPGSFIDQPSGQKSNYVKKYASGGCDNLIKLWKEEEDSQWKEEQKLKAHSDWIKMFENIEKHNEIKKHFFLKKLAIEGKLQQKFLREGMGTTDDKETLKKKKNTPERDFCPLILHSNSLSCRKICSIHTLAKHKQENAFTQRWTKFLVLKLPDARKGWKREKIPPLFAIELEMSAKGYKWAVTEGNCR